jgi:hypothetical protein
MAKMFALCQMSGGSPAVDFSATPIRGYVLCDQVASWGAYLFSGTGAQLTALAAVPEVVPIVAVTENGGTKWAELDGTIAPAVRTKLNTWLTNRGYPNIPAGWTYRRVVREIYERINPHFSLDNFDVAD